VYEITMPKLSDSMEVGKIIEWKVKEGQQVQEGDVLAEVESDKAIMELECFRDGTMKKIVHGNDEEVPVGEIIGFIATEPGELEEAAPTEEPVPERPAKTELAPEPEQPEEEPAEAEAAETPGAEQPPEEEAEEPEPAEGERAAISPYARRLAEEKGLDYRAIEGTGPEGRIVARDVQVAAERGGTTVRAREQVGPTPAGPINAEPLAAALAVHYGIDLSSVPGSGREGLVTVEDVVAARSDEVRREAPPLPDEEMPQLEVSEQEADIEEASFRMKTQARRVIGSQHAIPHFYVTRGVDVTALLARKDELKSEFGASLTHLIMLACVRALGEHPEVNRSYDRGRVIAWKGIHLGLAVDTDQGLTVAVLRDAQEFGLMDLVERTAELVERARAGKLSAEERQHATFTITNLGMFDVEHFEPIINPPSSITLAVSTALPAAVVRDEALAVGRVMKLTAACDHRIIDGATAARFLQDLRALLQDPEGLLEGA
jgi:pyruvate dehydrogenase E2 component (dihydrolipoamide acetyltransferase)